jgi:RNA polymerase sigma factor (sigma-70 family)
MPPMAMATTARIDETLLSAAVHRSLYIFVAAAIGRISPDVEDLVQETLLHAWRSRAHYRGDSSITTWVLSIAKNKIADRYRRAVRTTRCLRAVGGH